MLAMNVKIEVELAPRIVAEEEGFLVAYKPPGYHTTPLKSGNNAQQTLLEFCARSYPELRKVKGWNPWEGGSVHRLDAETHGLVLFARTQVFMDSIREQQSQGRFLKKYHALCIARDHPLGAGYPPNPLAGMEPFPVGRDISSGFRPFGPGGKAVRPTLDSSDYRTQLLSMAPTGGLWSLGVQISRGFRHQIRCHLAWIGYPIANDRVYGDAGAIPTAPPLALRAQGIAFYDPQSGTERTYLLADLPYPG